MAGLASTCWAAAGASEGNVTLDGVAVVVMQETMFLPLFLISCIIIPMSEMLLGEAAGDMGAKEGLVGLAGELGAEEDVGVP